MTLSDGQKRHWRLNRRMTLAFLLVWFLVSFVASFFAADLNQWTLAGFPLGFYIGAQGAPLVFLLLVVVYARVMNRLDVSCQVQDGEG
ncbi:DUF4212 domain-containing protein [Azospira inquinata]|uniref:DUF4212 domain-containing protein n=1 Tax=Azospira inquinata TaxID=2785627 RepID=A0A975SLQ7_9RHOO|nr:DUF4212 domain-containing protein [Azospira inquinata]QWT46028.1 DUF4212 domain-containing protein [Azospira inquinata]QWT48642.1 DUF4212 domain-containing protein [Azospira inquinata]